MVHLEPRPVIYIISFIFIFRLSLGLRRLCSFYKRFSGTSASLHCGVCPDFARVSVRVERFVRFGRFVWVFLQKILAWLLATLYKTSNILEGQGRLCRLNGAKRLVLTLILERNTLGCHVKTSTLWTRRIMLRPSQGLFLIQRLTCGKQP